jgi:hypothetical protein
MRAVSATRLVAVFATVVTLAGCATYRNGNLVQDGPGSELGATELAAFRENQDKVLVELIKLAQIEPTIARPAGVPDWDAVIEAGMDFADGKCEAYTHALFRLNRDRKTATSQIGLLGSATAGILAAVDAAAKEVAIVAIAFGLASSTVDNLSSNLLYDLDPSSIRTMTKALQASYRQGLPKSYSTRPAAMNVIRGYVALCLPANIEAEINLAVKKAQPTTVPGDAKTGRAPSVSNSETTVGNFTVGIDDNTAILKRFVFPDGVLNNENQKKLEKFIRDDKKLTVSVTEFMRQQQYAAERAEAVSRLKLSN